jgi:phosphomannomutase
MIRFGTDGWRGIIAEEFNFQNIRAFAYAVSRLLKDRFEKNYLVVVGYDTRFLSKEAAFIFAKILKDGGAEVILSKDAVPTPVVSWTVKENNANLGVVITASHNPPIYNGIKIKQSFGGPVVDDTLENLLKYFDWDSDETSIPSVVPLPEVPTKDIISPYVSCLERSFSWDKISLLKGPVLVDSMGGSGRAILYNLLKKHGVNAIAHREKSNPLFCNSLPEPIASNLNSLKEKINKHGALLGVATDGDADRLGILDEKGNFVSIHSLIALVLEYLVKHREENGTFVKTASVCSIAERVAKNLNIAWKDVSVGFANVTREFLNSKIVFGAEESGGWGFGCHIPDRDGLFSILLLLELLGHYKVTLNDLIKRLTSKYGESFYYRIDFPCYSAKRYEYLPSLLEKGIDKICAFNVTDIRTFYFKNMLNGLKFILGDIRWLLIRSSETEPIIRFYAEGESLEEAKMLVQNGIKLLKAF